MYGSLIDLAMEKGWGVFIFCDHRTTAAELGYKRDQFPAVEEIPTFRHKPNVIAVESVEALARIIRQNNIRVFFVANFSPVAKDLKEILAVEDYSLTIAQMQYFVELLELGHGEDFDANDLVYSYCENWVKWWRDYLVHANRVDNSSKQAVFDKIEKKMVPVGVPETDQVKDFDAAAIRRKYGIAPDKKVVLLLPFPWYGHDFPIVDRWSLWTHLVYKPQPMLRKILKILRQKTAWKFVPDILPDMRKGLNDRAVIKAIRTFCDKNNALLVVKARKKNPIAPYLEDISDYVFFDESFYPFTALELLFIAELSIGYLTMTVLESVLAQTPTLSLIPEYGALWPTDVDYFFRGVFSSEPGNFFNFPGVVYSESIADLVENFADKTFDDYKFDHKSRDKFVEKYLGYSDYRASERIYQDLCRRFDHA